VFFVSSSNSLIKNDCRGRRGLFDSAGSNTDPLGELGPAQIPDCHLGTIRRKVAGRQLCVRENVRSAVRSASTPCQLRVTSFASKSRLVDRHPLYVPASAAPHVRASHYGLRLAHCSEQYDHGPKITTTDWQTRSAGDEEVTNLEARGFDGWDHRRRRALVCGCVVERSTSDNLLVMWNGGLVPNPQAASAVYAAAGHNDMTVHCACGT